MNYDGYLKVKELEFGYRLYTPRRSVDGKWRVSFSPTLTIDQTHVGEVLGYLHN